MKPPILFLLLLLANSTTATYTPEALDYVLRCIEYEASAQPPAIYTPEALDYILRCIEYEASVAAGTLSLILYDPAPQHPFNNILSAILQSPRLEHVVKYVVNGTYQEGLEDLPWHPSMLLIHPGSDVRPTSAIYTPEALDYILRCIEYEASVAAGTLSLILYDLAPQHPFNNILSAILQSPRLEHVVKYVVNGTYQEGLEDLPWHPSMLLIHPGSDVRHLMRPNTSRDMNLVLELFNPTAKAFRLRANGTVVRGVGH
ncbi:conserved hypothetical protein [Culex quinquefasciatus]|uniref:Uncharacterized protein n=1 Tax=Culex quinquefasciatus TaxID=7176 RepID=B0XG29_CULQU|nr:conserved hypothetical protein [Culex quinquefasciatus]|eukprot:XP_001868601.1 conserved hypothetical protein [Culex quinquefasciatus]